VKKWFTALSIRAKLIAIILTVSVVIVTLIGGTRIIWDVQQARQTLAQELSALTRLLGDRSSAAMVFDDTRLGQENLASLHEIPHVKQAMHKMKWRLMPHVRQRTNSPMGAAILKTDACMSPPL